jgi:hypothetical protein
MVSKYSILHSKISFRKIMCKVDEQLRFSFNLVVFGGVGLGWVGLGRFGPFGVGSGDLWSF